MRIDKSHSNSSSDWLDGLEVIPGWSEAAEEGVVAVTLSHSSELRFLVTSADASASPITLNLNRSMPE
jgi:hypothetical protein